MFSLVISLVFENFSVPKLPVAQNTISFCLLRFGEYCCAQIASCARVACHVCPMIFFRFFAVPKLPVVLNSRLRCDFHYILVVQCVLATLCLLF